MKRVKPRSLNAQLNRMAHRWPAFERLFLGPGVEAWRGPLRGFQQDYQVGVVWNHGAGLPPLVHILEPKLKPRAGWAFSDIPHLIFDHNSPEDSALCLFDPELRQWTPAMLIADTTVPWASEWLHHYELWHYDGVWRGPSAPGPRSIGEGLGQDKLLPDAAVYP